MNIFYLDPDPIISAHMHCDQHLHKMILESAQMLSTAVHTYLEKQEFDAPEIERIIYKSSYRNHPCTQLVSSSLYMIDWVIKLCYELEDIRQGLGHNTHASMEVIKAIDAWYGNRMITSAPPYPAIFCGPAFIKLNNAAYPTVQSKYRAYYLHKAKQWALDGKPRMSYRGRSVPDFLKGCEYVSQ